MGSTEKQVSGRQVKDVLYAQAARIGKAVCSSKRLELIELLCQREKPVERLAAEAGISLKLASAHLKELRMAHLVEAYKEGKNVYYRLTGEAVELLRKEDFQAMHVEDGVAEWRVHGLSVVSES